MQSTLFVRLLAAIVILATPAAAGDQWIARSGTDNAGNTYAHLHILRDGVTLNMGCDQRNQATRDLSFKLFTPSVPNLYAQDDAEAVLTLQFGLPGGSTYGEKVSVWYFDGGVGDQAWVGKIQADAGMLDAFASAVHVDILNPMGAAVYRFPAKGTSAGVAAIRRQCGVGRP